MPGMLKAAPERTDTSNGFSALPKPLPVSFSSPFMCATTSSQSPAGSCFPAS